MTSSRSRRKPRPRLYSPRLWGAWLIVGAAWVLARLPLSWAINLGKGMGTAGYYLARHRRHVTEVNLGLCFPERSAAEREQLCRDTFRHAGVSLAEMALAWLNPRRQLSGRFAVEGIEHLQEALAQGRGVVLVSGHYACIDIGSQPLSQLGDIDVIYRPNKNPVWEWLQVRGRRHYFEAVIGRQDTRRMLRSLRAGRALWYAADQDYGRKHSVFAPFFGVPAATINATARLARFNGSPVVLMTLYRDLNSLSWGLTFQPPLADFPTGDPVTDATKINAIIEDSIRQRPTQYLWQHRRFKTRPPGEPGVYG